MNMIFLYLLMIIFFSFSVFFAAIANDKLYHKNKIRTYFLFFLSLIISLTSFFNLIYFDRKEKLRENEFNQKLIFSVEKNKELNDKIIFYFKNDFNCNKNNLNRVDCAITINKINKLVPDETFSNNYKLDILLKNEESKEINSIQ